MLFQVDCSNGEDERGCLKYADAFLAEQGFKLQGGAEAVAGLDLEECAKRCLQSKHCTCDSFSHNAKKRRCILGNRCEIRQILKLFLVFEITVEIRSQVLCHFPVRRSSAEDGLELLSAQRQLRQRMQQGQEARGFSIRRY